jgi:hypothetical protein
MVYQSGKYGVAKVIKPKPIVAKPAPAPVKKKEPVFGANASVQENLGRSKDTSVRKTGSSAPAPAPAISGAATTPAPKDNSVRKTSSSNFQNPFFSVEGQKERLTNAANYINAAFNPFAKDKITEADVNIKNTNLRKTVAFVAAHPYAIAGATAALSVAPSLLSAGAGSLRAGAAAKTLGAAALKTAPAGISKGLVAAGVIAGGALLLGSAGSGSLRAAPQDQQLTQNPQITTNPQQTPTQDTKQSGYSQPTQDTYYQISDSPGASIQGSPYQETPYYQDQAASQEAIQSTPSSITADQGASQVQSSSGTNWGLIALIAAGAYFLSR